MLLRFRKRGKGCKCFIDNKTKGLRRVSAFRKTPFIFLKPIIVQHDYSNYLIMVLQRGSLKGTLCLGWTGNTFIN